MNQTRELDCVALACDLPSYGLQRDDVGTALLVHGDGLGFEVEFVSDHGQTIALVTLAADQVRRAAATDVPHARDR